MTVTGVTGVGGDDEGDWGVMKYHHGGTDGQTTNKER